MPRLFLILAVFLCAVVPVAAKVAADEPAPGGATRADDGGGTSHRPTPPPAQKGRSSQVEVRLDALEAMERLQDVQIKEERRPVGGPAESADDAPQK